MNLNYKKLLNPRIDSTFKALFTQPTPESGKALTSFLSAAIEHEVKDVQIVQNEPTEDFAGQRTVHFDISAVIDNEEPVNIEMQACNQQYDYGKRAEYHAARLETNYLKKGDTWQKAPKVYQISILNFIYDNRTDNVVSKFSMKDEYGNTLSDRLNIIFIELPKLREYNESEIEKLSKLQQWALFFKEADKPEKQNLIEALAQKETGIMAAVQSLITISEDLKLKIMQDSIETAERDYISGIEAAELRGQARGKTEGIAIGEKKASLETARLMKMNDMPVEQISMYTGLSSEEIENL